MIDSNLAVSIGLFALLGGTARMLVRWNPEELAARKLGGVLASVLAAYIVAYAAAFKYPGQIGIIVPLCGLASWGGADVLTVALSAWLRRVGNGSNGWKGTPP